jgi:RimJ/RimL family protein N-acetyltransferase
MPGTDVPSRDGLPRATAIESGRLRLTPLVPDDAEALFPVLDDEALHAYIGGRPDRLEELRARIDGWSSQRSPDGGQAWLNWLVRSTQDARVLGTMQATVDRDANGLAAEVAWTIGSRDQRRGYASEAASAIVAWLRERGVTRIDAHVHPEHVASAGVARRAGLSPTDEVVDGEVVWRARFASSTDVG